MRAAIQVANARAPQSVSAMGHISLSSGTLRCAPAVAKNTTKTTLPVCSTAWSNFGP